MEPGLSKSLKDTMKLIIRTSEGELEMKQKSSYQKILDDFQWNSTVKQLVSHLETAANDYRERIARQQLKKH
jgi:DNA primase large subunit